MALSATTSVLSAPTRSPSDADRQFDRVEDAHRVVTAAWRPAPRAASAIGTASGRRTPAGILQLHGIGPRLPASA